MSTLANSILRVTLLGLFLAALPTVHLPAAELLGVEIEVSAEETVARIRTDQEVDYRVAPDGLSGVAVELRPVRVTQARQLAGGGTVDKVWVEPIDAAEPATRVTFSLTSAANPQFEILPGGVLELRFAGQAALHGQLARLVSGARLSVEQGPRYDASYSELPYPGGDPGWAVGCGVDVVVRAYRHSGFDLQQLIHQDILLDATAYGVAEADANIDHRRLRNLERFLKHRAERLAGIENLATILAEKLRPTELQSLLLEVYRQRAHRRRPAEVLADYKRNRFVRPAGPIGPGLDWLTTLLAHLPTATEALELSAAWATNGFAGCGEGPKYHGLLVFGPT